MKLFFILLLVLLMGVNLSPQVKKFEFEVSTGVSLVKPSELYRRAAGIEGLIQQYTGLLNTDYQSEGGFKENIALIPLNVSVNYLLSDRFYVKAGIEYAVGSNVGEESFQFANNGLTENHLYNMENTLSYLMPFVGAETRLSSAIGLYTLLGYNMAKLSHTYDFAYSENGYSQDITETIKASGSSIAIIIGAKYMHKLGKKNKLMVKVEYLYAKISSLSGDKQRDGSNSLGERLSETVDGTIFTYRMNPYGLGELPYWDLYESEPQGAWIQSARELALDISSIRLMLGFSF